MVVFPNAKINLGLNIISKRNDGYHNISSCFYPIPLADILEIQVAKSFTFKSTGLNIPDDAQNLCVKAYDLIKEDFDISPVNIHLHKIIPIGAGLGGGSADASFTLKCLNEIFLLKLDTEQLKRYAAKLGSDCPFFIESKPLLAQGTGDEFSPLTLNLSNFYLVVLNPNIHVSTAQAYRHVMPQTPTTAIKEILTQPMMHWQTSLKNDFEKSVFEQFPEIRVIKDQLAKIGAVYTSMSGSGSSVYGLFEKRPSITDNLKHSVIWEGQLKC